jgi:drug/metabolite transporter (DMT)-like permease
MPDRVPHSSATSDTATPLRAILLVLAAGLVFTCLDTSAKYLVVSGMDAPFVAWTRFAVHVVLVLILFRAWSNRAMFKVVSLPRQFVRGIFLFGSTFFNFLALRTLQLAETVSIFFFAPMVITALAGPLLGEWAGWRRWLAVLIGFIGVLVITRPGYGTFGLGHIYALGAMMSYCIYVIMTRQMGAKETAESLIFYSALAPVILMAPTVPFSGLQACDDLGAGALSLFADGLDDRARLSRLRRPSRPLDAGRLGDHRVERALHRPPRKPSAPAKPLAAQLGSARSGKKALNPRFAMA